MQRCHKGPSEAEAEEEGDATTEVGLEKETLEVPHCQL